MNTALQAAFGELFLDLSGVEHVFGDQKNGMRAEFVRTIGIVRAGG